MTDSHEQAPPMASLRAAHGICCLMLAAGVLVNIDHAFDAGPEWMLFAAASAFAVGFHGVSVLYRLR